MFARSMHRTDRARQITDRLFGPRGRSREGARRGVTGTLAAFPIGRFMVVFQCNRVELAGKPAVAVAERRAGNLSIWEGAFVGGAAVPPDRQ
jgi:hypothetical protein